jgi:hypothetical protein
MDIPKSPRTTADLILYDDVQHVFRKIHTILTLAGNCHEHHDAAADRLSGTPAANGLLRVSNDLLIESQELIVEQLEAAEDLVKWWWQHKDPPATTEPCIPVCEGMAQINGVPTA